MTHPTNCDCRSCRLEKCAALFDRRVRSGQYDCLSLQAGESNSRLTVCARCTGDCKKGDGTKATYWASGTQHKIHLCPDCVVAVEAQQREVA